MAILKYGCCLHGKSSRYDYASVDANRIYRFYEEEKKKHSTRSNSNETKPSVPPDMIVIN